LKAHLDHPRSVTGKSQAKIGRPIKRITPCDSTLPPVARRTYTNLTIHPFVVDFFHFFGSSGISSFRPATIGSRTQSTERPRENQDSMSRDRERALRRLNLAMIPSYPEPWRPMVLLAILAIWPPSRRASAR
jgi:hypothetical protein